MDTMIMVIAIIVIFVFILYIYKRIGCGEHFENKEEKQKELFQWFSKHGDKKSYSSFKNKFADKKADVVDFEKGRKGAREGSLTPEIFV